MPHPREQSRLYKIKSPAQLSCVLGVVEQDIRSLLRAADNYIRWEDRKSGRSIQRPKPLLKRVHDRAAFLLSRIKTPDFLHSSVKGRSYISNAIQHQPLLPSVKIDIRQFYPSARSQAVFHFFRDRMKCNGDVAGILARLLTVDGHLPTGSSVSPILSYFAYEDMYEEISILAKNRGCTMTCYVDDIVITGPCAGRRMIYDLKRILRKYRFTGHKTKLFRPQQPRVITGVAVTAGGCRLPNKRRINILEDASLVRSVGGEERTVIARRLVGRLYEAAQIDPRWRSRALAMATLLRDQDP